LLPAKPFGIAGWSTGAIMAWIAAENVAPYCIVCLSATPAFCRRPGFTHGQHPSMLRAMRKKLVEQPGAVLESFYEECGVPEEHLSKFQISVPSLVAGLHFLEQASLFPLEPSGIPALFLHGDSDTIVPTAAGRYFSQQANGLFEAYDGPHAFFISQYAPIRKRIARFAGDGI
jgi:surfactin synthase thioesterase subunit